MTDADPDDMAEFFDQWPEAADDFTADRHADLDPGEGGMMADADYYDRIHAGNVPASRHDGPCIYCEHGPYCLACPPPPVVADDAPVCGRCREAITRSEIAADPYYGGGAAFGDGA